MLSLLVMLGALGGTLYFGATDRHYLAGACFAVFFLLGLEAKLNQRADPLCDDIGCESATDYIKGN